MTISDLSVAGPQASSRPEYTIYICAKGRCRNPNAASFHLYGGRGIEFRFNSFADFFAEVGHRPTSKHSLDRINNDGHYEAGNVRWATYSEQARNTRANNWVTINDQTKTVVEWAELYGLGAETVRNRKNNLKWCNNCLVLPVGAVCLHRSRPNFSNTKLTPEIVADMRARAGAGVSHRTLADEYGVSYFTARDACIGRTWKNEYEAIIGKRL